MVSFPMNDVTRRVGDVFQAAEHGPVSITKNRKNRYVIMSQETYDKLLARRADPRRVLDLRNLSPEDAMEFEQALNQALGDG
jgi:PHD/YefM family antitoxin component YafN of YafNO toxin-antitoxin module